MLGYCSESVISCAFAFTAQDTKKTQRRKDTKEIFLQTDGIKSRGYPFRCTMRAPAGTLSVTQMFPPMVAPRPMVMRPKIVALE